MKDCEICRNSRFIRLPVYRRASVSMLSDVSVDATASMDDLVRQYPCPECSTQVAEDQVAILHGQTWLDPRIVDSRYEEIARRSAAHTLVDGLLERGFIDFEVGPEMGLRKPLVATIGVVSKKAVTTIEARVAERQDQVARAVAEEAKEGISVWGRDYGHTHVAKAQAYDSINEALKRVLATWSRVRALGIKA